ncbi:hypothetical protein ACFQ6V_23740 [Streptomyces roseifaciens]
MTTNPETLTVSEDDACPCGLCDESEDCTACDGDGGDPDGYGKCWTCDGEGTVTPEHCCACGGSPYCACCRTCGAECIGSCSCPVTVTLADGTVKTLPPAQDEPADEQDWEPADDRDSQPPEDYYDAPAVVGDSAAAEGSHSHEPPFPDDPPVPTDDLPDWPHF